MTKIHLETFGQGKSIVLVHGWAMHTGIWRDFAKQLALNYQVTCIDLPGHGHSELIDPFTLERISAELLKAIPGQGCCWLGWSLGATVVLDVAARYPERVSSLVLLAGNPLFPSSGSRLYTQAPTGHRHSGMDCRNPDYMDVCSSPSMALGNCSMHCSTSCIHAVVDTCFPAGMTNYLDTFVYKDENFSLETETWPGMDVQLLDDFAEQLNKNCQATLLRFLSLQVNGLPEHKALLKALKSAVFECDAPDQNTLQGGLDILKQADLRPVLSGLTMPVSVILGGLDTLVPVAVGQKMQQLLPSLELNIIDRAGHVPFLSHSRETLAIISRFMDQRCS
ncbi:MAG: alpha/beta fold hydrolase [Methylobacter sp.]|nr:MAG: alpha/beta fold hydrolase [Methylobacter sp.]